MSLATPSVGLVAAALVATGIALPMAAAGSASAACQDGVKFNISGHKRVFIAVQGAKITFTKAGKHTVEISKKSTLSAQYGTGDGNDQGDILDVVKENWPQVRNAVAVTKGHQQTFRSSKGERVTVTYESKGDRVHWTKIDVDSDCSTTVLDEGVAKFPRKNLDWIFAVSIS
jgi:plastocyanin